MNNFSTKTFNEKVWQQIIHNLLWENCPDCLTLGDLDVCADKIEAAVEELYSKIPKPTDNGGG
jgi:hypothetical protein